jgi:hypothetical protein
MVEITWTIRGRHIDPATLEDEVERAVVEDVTAQLRDTLEGVVCPQHGTPPREVAVTGESFDQFGFQINGCCLKVREAAAAAFRKAQEAQDTPPPTE